METVVGVEGSDEVKCEDSTVFKSISAPSSPKQIADTVVYQLVRVEGDGSLVPATDDEVMEVEDLLEDDKSELRFVANTGPIIGYTSGMIQSDDPELAMEKSRQLDKGVDSGKLNAQLEDIVSPLATSSNEPHIDQSGGIGECSDPLGGHVESGSSTSALCTSSKPDFSKLRGEICLDNLSIKELQETFKAAFGRETSVEDKQWLKRRIAMGLSNSCDVTTTTFVVEDNGVVKKGKEENRTSVEGTPEPLLDHNETENPQNVSGSPGLEDDDTHEDLHMEERTAKRVRKPTRRYIEELSEVESWEYSGKLISSVGNSGHGESPPRSRVERNVRLDGKPVVTRQDSLGGSGVQVPYVSRIRRSRPRENFVALMRLQPGNMGMAAKLVKKALDVHSPQPDNEEGNNSLFKVKSDSGWIQQPLIHENKKDEQNLERTPTESDKDVELKHMDSSGDKSDDNVVTVAPVKGGTRRKHHRPWTLSEVVKLVEGVARFGAGRWSEIKRLSFASYSYRTSVDLKDKWRNLLRASTAELPAEKGLHNSRKHVSMPIPAPILSRVRELAEMQAQVTPNLSSSRFTGSGCSDTSVHETKSGYL